ncbi:MAG: GNAT family N-acetyltransferase [Acetobacteraceae bacterium]
MVAADYPVELEEHWQAGGEGALIRPIRPDDAAALDAFFHRLSPEEVRFRFFASVRDLTPEQLAQFTCLDYDRDMALVAAREGSGELVGVARLTRRDASHIAEFAIVVWRGLQGRGLAVHLMRRLLAWAARHGVREVVGSILAENPTMLELARFLGFKLVRLPADPQVVEARLSLVSLEPDEPSQVSG